MGKAGRPSAINWLPISGLTSYNYDQLSGLGKLLDRARGTGYPVDAGMIRYPLLRSTSDMWVIDDVRMKILQRFADGTADVLLPEPNEPVPRVRKGQSVTLPTDGSAFRFQPPGGTHRLRLIACR